MSSRKTGSSRAKRIELGFLEGIRRRCPDNARVLKPLGDLYTQVGRLREGLEVDQELTRLCPEDAEVWYNLGCSYALTEQKADALTALARAIELGYSDRQWMLKDKDLALLKGDPQFNALLKKLKRVD